MPREVFKERRAAMPIVGDGVTEEAAAEINARIVQYTLLLPEELQL